MSKSSLSLSPSLSDPLTHLCSYHLLIPLHQHSYIHSLFISTLTRYSEAFPEPDSS